MRQEGLTVTNKEQDISLSDILPNPKEKDGDGTTRTKEHFVLIRVLYPDDELSKHASLGENRTGWLIYIKSTLNGDESAEMLLHQKSHPQFPHDETLDQFFEPKRFMLYRQLGEHMGDDVCKQLFQTKGTVTWLANNWMQGRGSAQKGDIDSIDSKPKLPADRPLEVIDGTLTQDRLNQILEHLDSGTGDQCQLDCVYLREHGQSGHPKRRRLLVAAIQKRLLNETDCSTRIELCIALSWVGKSETDALQTLQKMKESAPEELVRKTCELLLPAMGKKSTSGGKN